MNLRFLLFTTLVCAGCHSGGAPSPTLPAASPKPEATLEIVESAPLETALDHPDIPNADTVWLKMITGAKHSIDIAEFYVSDEKATRLTKIIDAIHAAVQRHVKVRVLVEEKFYSKYPETIARLESYGATIKRLSRFNEKDGILHAKYFVVDGVDSFVGSQNFDWRALEHIQEVGVHVRSADFARQLSEIFESDWRYPAPSTFSPHLPLAMTIGEFPAQVTLAASPKGAIGNDAEWDLPKLVALVERAQKEIHLQVLTYATISRYGGPFFDLHNALLAAAKRGVQVHVLVSSWMRKENTSAIDELSKTPGVYVKVITVPAWSGGEIPFARVAHAKYMTADGTHAWVGTSNWEGNYFNACRNISVFITSAPAASTLNRIFKSGWESDLSRAW